jgi:Fuc2NAc and GlcNAc transferase
MVNLPLLVLTSFLIGWLATVWVRRHASRLRLVSIPNHRSSHVAPTPHGGGVGIVLAGSATGFWLAWQHGAGMGSLIAILGIVVATTGLIDDIRHLPARVRFVVQALVCAAAMAYVGLFALPDNDQTLNQTLSALIFVGIVWLAGVWWINLFNFMDGIDAIAGIEAVFMLLAGAGLMTAMHPDASGSTLVLWMLLIAAATAGFLTLNWPPAGIFMGDVGSTYLAFMIFVFALVSAKQGWLTYTTWLILGAVFICDSTYTLLRRIVAGERWFEAHRSHAYQRLARRFASHRRVALIAIGFNLFWLLPLAWLNETLGKWTAAILVMAYIPLTIGVALAGAGRKDHV